MTHSNIAYLNVNVTELCYTWIPAFARKTLGLDCSAQRALYASSDASQTVVSLRLDDACEGALNKIEFNNSLMHLWHDLFSNEIENMFNLITASSTWLTNIPTIGLITETISAYRLQNIRAGISYVNTVRPGIANETMKFFFNTEKLPNVFKAFNPAYEKVRAISIKAGRILKPVVMSKKTSAALSALSTANTLLGNTSLSGFPIILCATGAALATYYGEQRKESITEAKASLDTVSIPPSYEQPNVAIQKHSYTFPYPMEIVKMGLDLSMSGIASGISSYGFALAGGKLAYNIYSEAKNYLKISELKSSLTKPVSSKTSGFIQLNPDRTQRRINRSSGRGL